MGTEFVHDIVELHGFGNVDRLQQQIGQLHILVVYQLLQQMLHIQDAHHMVNGALVDRITGELGLSDGIEDMIHAVMELKTNDIDTGSQNIRRVQIGEFQGGLQQFGLAFVDNAFVLSGIQQVFQLLLGNGNSPLIPFPQDTEEVNNGGGDPDHREAYDHQHQQGPGGQFGNGFAAAASHHLGGDFTDNEDQNRHNQGDEGGGGLVGDASVHPDSQIHGQNRCHRSSADVHKVVANQDSGQGKVEVIVNKAHKLLGSGGIFGIPLDFQLAQRGIGDFRSGEEGGTHQQEEDQKICHI